MAKILICIEIGGPNQCRILIVFATGGLKLSFKALGGHKNCYSELRILISCRHGCPKFWFASKIGGQTRVLTWSFCCTILVAFANGGLSVPLNILKWLQSCYSERRILIGRRHVTPEFWFASKFSGQTQVLTWSFCCTILIAFQVSLHSLCYGWRVGIVYTHSFGDRPRGRQNNLTLPYLKLGYSIWWYYSTLY